MRSTLLLRRAMHVVATIFFIGAAVAGCDANDGSARDPSVGQRISTGPSGTSGTGGSTGSSGGNNNNNNNGTSGPTLFNLTIGDPKDILSHAASGRIFVTNGSGGGASANKLVEIDPAGRTSTEYSVSGSPTFMEQTSDGQFIYIVVGDEIARFDVATRTVGQRFTIPPRDSFSTPVSASDIAAIPGQPLVIAVARMQLGVSPPHEGVIVFDNGVKRTNETQDHTGSDRIEAGVAGVAAVTSLFGYTTGSTNFGFRRLQVDASGATEVDVTQNLISGFGVDIEFDAGRIYSTDGDVIDPSTTPPSQVTELVGIAFADGVEPDASINRVFFLQGSQILVFDQTTFALVRSFNVTIPADAGSSPRELVRWGTNGLAFLTTTTVITFSSPLVGP